MLVKNIKGTADRTCNCGTWLAHWERFAGVRAMYCGVLSCLSEAEVGAHVVKEGGTDKAQYIVPMCKKHNAESNKSIVLSSHIVMIPANISVTCGMTDSNSPSKTNLTNKAN